MTRSEMINKFKLITGENDAELFEVYMDLAREAILARRYPFGFTEETKVPEKYEGTWFEIALRNYERNGAEGQTYHSENGVHRTYGNLNDDDLLSRIVPIGVVM